MKQIVKMFFVDLLAGLIAMFFVSLFIGCTKSEDDTPACKTCDVNVKYWVSGQGNQYYIESSTKYCNGEWAELDGDVEIRSGTNSGVAFKKTSTTICHD